MQYLVNNYTKIYSRKRIKFPKMFKENPKIRRNKRKIKKTMTIIWILIIAIATCYIMWNGIDPVFEKLCEDKAISVATKITNEETSKVMNKYNYETFFTVEKDEKGNIQMITANVLKINQITSDIGLNIQNALEKSKENKIYISSGALTGIGFFSGYGPRIAMSIDSSGNVETNVRSEFISQGVNQTIHRVYLDVKTNVNILTSFEIIEKTIQNQVLILENVILGEIPSTYLNL